MHACATPESWFLEKRGASKKSGMCRVAWLRGRQADAMLGAGTSFLLPFLSPTSFPHARPSADTERQRERDGDGGEEGSSFKEGKGLRACEFKRQGRECNSLKGDAFRREEREYKIAIPPLLHTHSLTLSHFEQERFPFSLTSSTQVFLQDLCTPVSQFFLFFFDKKITTEQIINHV